MSQRNQRGPGELFVQEGLGLRHDVPMKFAEAIEIRIAGPLGSRDVGWTQEGNGEGERLYLTGRTAQRNQHAGGVHGAVGATRDRPNHMDVESGEEIGGGFQSGGGIVIAGGDDHLQGGTRAADPGEELVELTLRPRGRTDAVEDVAGNDERVGVSFDELAEQPVEEMGVLGIAIEAVEQLAQMPVRRVDESKRHGNPR